MASLRQQLKRARTLYVRNPTGARLRAYLTLKARLGQFDKRMCGYYGVDPNVNAECKKAICRAFVAGLVPTSTTGGKHAPGSFHGQRNSQGQGRAVDFGLRKELVGTKKGYARLATFQRKEFWRRSQKKVKPAELIGPINALTVLRYQHTGLSEGSALEQAHDNHVHVAF